VLLRVWPSLCLELFEWGSNRASFPPLFQGRVPSNVPVPRPGSKRHTQAYFAPGRSDRSHACVSEHIQVFCSTHKHIEFVPKIKFRIQLRLYHNAAVRRDNLATATSCVAAFHHEGTCLSCSSVLSGRRDNLRGRLSLRGMARIAGEFYSVCPFAPCGERQATWTGPARPGKTA